MKFRFLHGVGIVVFAITALLVIKPEIGQFNRKSDRIYTDTVAGITLESKPVIQDDGTKKTYYSYIFAYADTVFTNAILGTNSAIVPLGIYRVYVDSTNPNNSKMDFAHPYTLATKADSVLFVMVKQAIMDERADTIDAF